MRTIFNSLRQTYILVILGTAFSLIGCEEQEDLGAPSITIYTETKTYYPGDTVTITLDITAPGKLKSIVIGADTITDFNEENFLANFSIPYHIPPNTPVGNHFLTIAVTDHQTPTRTSIASIVIKVQTVPINEDIKLLAGVNPGGKSWILKQGQGALFIGPDEYTVWWTNPEETVSLRPCLFNNEWVFKNDGTVHRNMNGDIYVDAEGEPATQWPTDMPPSGCHAITEIPSQYRSWGDGDFTYRLEERNLTITGVGAYVGLYKVGEKSAATATPNAQLTYKVELITETELVISKRNGNVYWRFTLQPKT